ncbi:MAG: hypothetical protein HKN09_03630 [Saprospiraceae bacterium]|nr:hypothetical protein [Saprospiraceae bacterium]
MHDIEPYFKWRQYYISSEDKVSPFYGREYSEFMFTNKVYNYFIHPQWDSIGSSTLYLKVLYVDYDEQYAMIELLGEWNDCLNNDIMFLKRHLADHMISEGINKFILFCDNVLNFHASDDSYYEEWWDDIKEEGGWICIINTLDHVLDEMEGVRIQYYSNIGDNFNDLNWRIGKPKMVFNKIQQILENNTKQLSY